MRYSTEQAVKLYRDIYDDPNYKMGLARHRIATYAIDQVPRGTLLDVGCGRGEMMDTAQALGFEATGVEASHKMTGDRVHYGLAQVLPFGDNEFDVVTMFDVMEHLPSDDVDQVLKELRRVAKKHIVLTISNLASIHKGVDLHITKKPYPEWDALLNDRFDNVTWMNAPKCIISELWRIDL